MENSVYIWALLVALWTITWVLEYLLADFHPSTRKGCRVLDYCEPLGIQTKYWQDQILQAKEATGIKWLFSYLTSKNERLWLV